MGNCPACLSGRYSIQDMVSEEGDQIGGLGSSTDGIKVVRVTDGKVFEYKTASSSSNDDDDVDDRPMQCLRAKDVISQVQGGDEGGVLYALFDHSSYSQASTDISNSSNLCRNEKKRNKKTMQQRKRKSSEEKDYNSKPLHPETLLKISHLYYLRPASAAPTANYDHNILSSVSCLASTATATAIKAPSDKQKKKKKVRFSDHVVFIEPPAPSSRYSHHRQLGYTYSPPAQLAVIPNILAAAPLSKLEDMAQPQSDTVCHDDDGGAPMDERHVAGKGPAVVRVKLLLSKRELCDLLAATGQYQRSSTPRRLSREISGPFAPPTSNLIYTS